MNKFLDMYSYVITILLLWATGTGFMAEGRDGLAEHVLPGLIAPMAGIMGLVVLMFYFISTGAVIREVVEKKLMDTELYMQTKVFKKELFPWIMSSIMLFIIAPVLGAAYDAGKLSLVFHTVISLSALVLYVIVTRKAKGYMKKNKPIFHEAVIITAGLNKPETQDNVETDD